MLDIVMFTLIVLFCISTLELVPTELIIPHWVICVDETFSNTIMAQSINDNYTFVDMEPIAPSDPMYLR